MPDGRFLSKSIAYSAQVGAVSLEADYLFMRMIPHLDREGRMVGAPASVKALCCPLRPELTPDRVAAALQELHDAGLVIWYEAKGDRFAALPGFASHQRGARLQREAPSRLPAPPRIDSAKLRQTPPNDGHGRVSEVKVSEVKQSKELLPGADAPAKKPRGERPAPRYPGFSKDDCDRLYVVWQRFGAPPYSAFRSALGPLFEGPAPCTADDLELGMREAISRAESDPKEAGYLNIHSFAQKARWWIGEAKGRPLAVNAAGILQVAR